MNPIKTSGAQSEIRDGVDDISDGVVNIGVEVYFDGTHRKSGGQ